jgi:hypothetical protein
MKNSKSTALVTLGDLNATDFTQASNGIISVNNSVKPRQYFSELLTYQNRFVNSTATDIVGTFKFTAIGGATVSDSVTTYGTPAYRCIKITATRAVASTALNNLHVIPTQYVMHEVPIRAGKSHQYLINYLQQSEPTLEVWICDPNTGIPARRVYAQAAVAPGTFTVSSMTVQRAPDNGYGLQDFNRGWVGFELDHSVVNTYKTSNNTLKLALRPGMGNGGGDTFLIAGYAMCVSEYSHIYMPILTFENTANIPDLRSATEGAVNYPKWGGFSDGVGWCVMKDGESMTFYIPIPDTSKSYYITALNSARDANLESGFFGSATAEWLIGKVGDTSPIFIGRPSPDLVAPSANVCTRSVAKAGIVVKGIDIVTKLVYMPYNACPYIPLQIRMPNAGIKAYLMGFVLEEV